MKKKKTNQNKGKRQPKRKYRLNKKTHTYYNVGVHSKSKMDKLPPIVQNDLDIKHTSFHIVGSKENRRRINRSRMASRNASRATSPSGRTTAPVSNNPFQDKEIVNMIRRVIETMKEEESTPKPIITQPAPAAPPKHPFLDEATADMVRNLMVTMMEEKHRSSEKRKVPSDEFADLEARDDFVHCINEYASYGVPHGLDASKMNEYTTRRLEMAYWRQKLHLQERELENNVKTVISVGSDVLESFLTAMNVTSIHVKGLGKRTQTAVDEGKFHQCIRYYSRTMPPDGNSMFCNPYVSFMSAFAAVAFRNHLDCKQAEADAAAKTKTTTQRKKKNQKNTSRSHRDTEHLHNVRAGRISPNDIHTSYHMHPSGRPLNVISTAPMAYSTMTAQSPYSSIPYEELMEKAQQINERPFFTASATVSESEEEVTSNVFQSVAPTLNKIGRHGKKVKHLKKELQKLEASRHSIEEI